MSEKVVFLDVDGVLNTPDSKSRCNGCIGIDSSKVVLLKEIVEATGAEIVLVSTWKEYWERLPERKYLQDEFANYLDEVFNEAGLKVTDKTLNGWDADWYSRGEGILDYIQIHKPKSFVILDDIQYDYDGCGLTDNLIQTNANVGLTSEQVQQAIKILNKR